MCTTSPSTTYRSRIATYEATYTWNKGSSSIGSITTDGLSDTPVYTLAGLYVANPSKGLYISNGKKFINK